MGRKWTILNRYISVITNIDRNRFVIFERTINRLFLVMFIYPNLNTIFLLFFIIIIIIIIFSLFFFLFFFPCYLLLNS